MANIRVTCPTCKSELEVDEEFDGQEVECGSCGHLFVARGRSATGKPPGTGPSDSRRSEPEPRARAERDERGGRERNEPERDERDRDRNDDRDERDEGRERRPAPRSRRPPPRPRRRRSAEDYEPSLRDDYDDDDGPPPGRDASVYNGLAVTALVFGLIDVAMVIMTLPLACCCALLPLPFTTPLSLVAIGTGAFGLRADPERKPLAIVGIVLGALCLVFVALQLAFGFIPQMNDGR
jgi:predicted Zn finger-like uncharacterized protein